MPQCPTPAERSPRIPLNDPAGEGSDAGLTDMEREHAFTTFAASIEHVVESAPGITNADAERLAGLLKPAADWVDSDRHKAA